jgi:hypothetical protein
MRNRLFLGSIRASQLGCPEKGNGNETNWLPVKKTSFYVRSLTFGNVSHALTSQKRKA